jgi:hypothetical protein
MGTFRHNWIATKKKEGGNSAVRKQLVALYPNMRDDELDLLATINTKKEVDAYLKELGQETKK